MARPIAPWRVFVERCVADCAERYYRRYGSDYDNVTATYYCQEGCRRVLYGDALRQHVYAIFEED
ncbi:hypothetical protein PABY_08250 [Pyrodictium abyssi]|uniref:MYM-type domain-containing protein n=2 Tax=Pyrodictium abyssi TaxID=54256 RepID=A0ABM8IYM7_9CREN|nr:hypothetical protein PABY_08250 [Pyrodictium abyssi]